MPTSNPLARLRHAIRTWLAPSAACPSAAGWLGLSEACPSACSADERHFNARHTPLTTRHPFGAWLGLSAACPSVRPQSTRRPSGRAPKRGPSTEYFFIVEELEDRSLLSLTGGLVENALDGLVNPEQEEDPLAATMLLPTTPNENLFENTPSNIPHEIDLPDTPLQASSPLGADGTGLVIYDSHDVPVIIPDLSTVTSTITITDSFRILDIDVQLNIEHTWDSDLDVFLIGPDGTRVELFTGVGGGAQNFAGTILDDEAAIRIANGSAPFIGRFRPEGLLSTFDDQNVQGTWTLEITDSADFDTGILRSWSLIVDDLPITTVDTGDTLGTATLLSVPLGIPVVTAETIDAFSDVDMFAFDLVAGETLLADIDAEVLGSSLDSILRLFDATGMQLAFNDDSNGVDSAITYVAPASGRYYLGVSSFANFSYDPNLPESGTGGSVGFYDLTIAVDTGDTLGTATLFSVPLGIPVVTAETIDAFSDVDMFAFDLVAGETLMADIDAEVLGSSLDSILRLFDATGRQLAFNDDSNGVDSAITYVAPASGRYYLGVSSWANFSYDPNVAESGTGESVGFYDLRIQVVVGTAEIHGSVWHDADGDGARSPTEASLEGWTIFLDQNGNRLLDPDEIFTASGANGDYAFRIDPSSP